MLEKAVALDSQYARAWAELGVFYLVTAAWGMGPGGELLAMAREQAQKAFELDPEEPQAHIVLGGVAGVYDKDWKTAERHFRIAMAQDTVPAETHARYAVFYLFPLGRLSEAAAEFERALENNPLSFLWRTMFAATLGGMSRHQEAIAQGKNALELNEDSWLAHQWMAMSYALLGRFSEARQAAEIATRLAPWNSHMPAILAAILSLSGEPIPDHLQVQELTEIGLAVVLSANATRLLIGFGLERDLAAVSSGSPRTTPSRCAPRNPNPSTTLRSGPYSALRRRNVPTP